MDEISQSRKHEINELIALCKVGDKSEIAKRADKLGKISGNFILTAFEFQYRLVDREGPFQLLICVGTEMLLNTIIILEAPEKYVELFEQKQRPPTFEKVKQLSKLVVTKDFDNKQKDRFEDVLDLIQNKRNIFAHFSLGIHARYYQHYEILNAILFLFEKYLPSHTETINKISEMKERFRMKNEPGYDFVDFL